MIKVTNNGIPCVILLVNLCQLKAIDKNTGVHELTNILSNDFLKALQSF